ncbi:competence protein CoiA family protein [Streptomyces collinus]|uniref:competence protein CoiA family protein n=1 Tax=Streptomyces collinus TaxID=42684 RepID=UPI0038155603
MAPISLSDEYDTRKVQTAVLGGAGSGRPVFLPYDHTDFDRFMRGRGRDDFYCGTLLGGCGKILTVRRSEVKKCHFAHRPPIHCRRTAVGEDSADHLYIGQALQHWLKQQGQRRVIVDYIDLGSGPGGAVEVRFDSGRSVIRVQMDRMPLRGWQTARLQSSTKQKRIHWTYGPGSGLAHNEVAEHGHAVRFECRTVGHTREVYVGTQLTDHTIDWVPLAEARLSEDGVVTPRLAPTTGNHDTTLAPALVAFPLLPGTIAFTGTVQVSRSNDDTHFYDADVQPRGFALTRARISLPRRATQPVPHRLHVIDGVAHLYPLLNDDEGLPRWLIEADECSPLAETADPRWPDLHPAIPVPQPRPVTAPSPVENEQPLDEGFLDEHSVVDTFRTKLTQIARSRGIINWEKLVTHAGFTSGDFTPADRVRLLVTVDHPRADQKPVLSSLVKLYGDQPGTPPPFFADVLAGLGWKSGLSDVRVREIHQREIRNAYAVVSQTSTTSAGATDTTTRNDRFLVGRFREHLHLVAIGHGLIKWENLLKRQGIRANTVSAQERTRLLAAMDWPLSADKPVLSALVQAEGSHSTALFEAVLRELGWKPTAAAPTVAEALKVERNRAYAWAAAKAKGRALPRGHSINSAAWRRDFDFNAVVNAVRQALIEAAHRKMCVGWQFLASAAGHVPGDFKDRDREAILVSVDRMAAPVGVLLSSLVIGPGHTPVPYFDNVLRQLGRPHGLRPIELGTVRRTEQERAFAFYGRAADTSQ